MITTTVEPYESGIYQSQAWTKCLEKLTENPNISYPYEVQTIYLKDGDNILPISRCTWKNIRFKKKGGQMTEVHGMVGYDCMLAGGYGGVIGEWIPKLKEEFANLLTLPGTLWVRLLDFDGKAG